MLYLYQQKFDGQTFEGHPLCPLMQVQAGNIFIVDDGQCVLGGYENTLLGYRTALYATLAHNRLLEYSDVIMFGEILLYCTSYSQAFPFYTYLGLPLASSQYCR